MPDEKRPLAKCAHNGDPDRHDQSVDQGSRAFVCQRAVGGHSLPNHNPATSVNRPVRTRMLGGGGAYGADPPGYPIMAGVPNLLGPCALRMPSCSSLDLRDK